MFMPRQRSTAADAARAPCSCRALPKCCCVSCRSQKNGAFVQHRPQVEACTRHIPRVRKTPRMAASCCNCTAGNWRICPSSAARCKSNPWRTWRSATTAHAATTTCLPAGGGGQMHLLATGLHRMHHVEGKGTVLASRPVPFSRTGTWSRLEKQRQQHDRTTRPRPCRICAACRGMQPVMPVIYARDARGLEN